MVTIGLFTAALTPASAISTRSGRRRFGTLDAYADVSGQSLAADPKSPFAALTEANTDAETSPPTFLSKPVSLPRIYDQHFCWRVCARDTEGTVWANSEGQHLQY